MTRILAPAFLISGAIALVCAPGILIAERQGWSEAPFHLTQLAATFLCFPTAVAYLVLARGSRARGAPVSRTWMKLAWTAVVLAGGWLAFYVFVILMLVGFDS